MYNAFQYIVSNDGIDSSDSYPYYEYVRLYAIMQRMLKMQRDVILPAAIILPLLSRWQGGSDVRKCHHLQW